LNRSRLNAYAASADIRADHTIYDEITGRGIALVCINGSMEGSGVASVSTNDHAATVVAYRHLRASPTRR
jgi:DNA-binding LacI/PurR family transcriptional regulator